MYTPTSMYPNVSFYVAPDGRCSDRLENIIDRDEICYRNLPVPIVPQITEPKDPLKLVILVIPK